jgi:hypothetical protein
MLILALVMEGAGALLQDAYNDPNACRDVNPINQGCTDEQGNRYSVGAIRTVCGQPNSCVVQ